MDKHDLYELAVTDADRLVPFLKVVHGKKPRVLREDFSGTGAVARGWAKASRSAEAIAVDVDPEVLVRAEAPRVLAVCGNVMASKNKADIVAATNFPLGYWHSRRDLLAYLKHARSCLNKGGVLVADLYGGRDAFSSLKLTQKLKGPGGESVQYIWEQRDANPVSGLVLDTLSFVVKPRSGPKRVHRDAFVYLWRLWSIPELQDAMLEAGFRTVEVYDRVGGAMDERGRVHARPFGAEDQLDENYVVYVVGRR